MNIFGPNKTPLQKFLETDNLAYLYSGSYFDWAILAAYFLVLSVLAVYGIHRYHKVYLYYKYKDNKPRPAGKLPCQPRVTIQLDRKSTRLNSSHIQKSRMPSSA